MSTLLNRVNTFSGIAYRDDPVRGAAGGSGA